jgi:ketosteroid isomerase-like protein
MQRRDLLATAAAAAATTLAPRPADAAEADVVRLLEAFAAAWNAHDVDALMACMADECAFEASAGPDVAGTRHAGREAVRAAFAAVFATYPDARWNEPRTSWRAIAPCRNGASPARRRTA